MSENDDLTPRGIRLGVMCQAASVDLVKLLASHPAPDADKIGCAVMMWDHMGNFTVASNGKSVAELVDALGKVKHRDGESLVEYTRERAPAPRVLWERARGDREAYEALLETYGYARGTSHEEPVPEVGEGS